MTSRTHGKTLLALSLVCLTATACSGQGASDVVAEGRLSFSTDIDPKCIDPHQSPLAATLTLTRGLVDSLVYQNPISKQFEPWLASSWEISEDATQYTFTLRPKVTFSDGKPVNSEAVKANFDRIADPESKSLAGAGLLGGYKDTVIKDDRTFTVRFKQPNAPFLQGASTPNLGMESPASLAGSPQATCQKIVGSGPFTLRSYTTQQSMVLDKRNGYRWAPTTLSRVTERATIDQVTITFAPENGVRMGKLKSHQVDAVANVPPAEAGPLSTKFNLLAREQPGLAYSLFINPRVGPWGDVRLRRAFGMALDTQQIVRSLYHGRYRRATSPLTTPTPGYLALLEKDPYDRKAAGRLFEEAGWVKGSSGYLEKDGKRLSLTWTYPTPVKEQRDVLAQLVQQQLKTVGVQITLNPKPVADVVTRQAQGTWELSDLSLLRADGDLLRAFIQPAVPGGVPFMKDAELTKNIGIGTSSQDQGERIVAYQNAQRRLIDQALIFPVYNPTSLVASARAVHGLTIDAQGVLWFSKVRTGQ